MDKGLLWHDTRPVEEAVTLAATRYAQKFGQTANVCYVHPAALQDGAVMVGTVHVAPSPRIIEKHFWIGVEAEA